MITIFLPLLLSSAHSQTHLLYEVFANVSVQRNLSSRHEVGCITNDGATMYKTSGRITISSLGNGRETLDIVHHGLRKAGNVLVPYSLTDSQAAYVKDTKGIFPAWEYNFKKSTGWHLKLVDIAGPKTLAAMGGPFLTDATTIKPYFQFSILKADKRQGFPNIDGGFWLRTKEEIVRKIGGKLTGRDSGVFFIARKPNKNSSRWAIERHVLGAGKSAASRSRRIGTWSFKDFDVLAWNPKNGEMVVRMDGSCAWLKPNGQILRKVVARPFSVVFSPQGPLLSMENQSKDAELWLWTNKNFSKVMDGFVVGISPNQQYIVIQQGEKSKLMRYK